MDAFYTVCLIQFKPEFYSLLTDSKVFFLEVFNLLVRVAAEGNQSTRRNPTLNRSQVPTSSAHYRHIRRKLKFICLVPTLVFKLKLNYSVHECWVLNTAVGSCALESACWWKLGTIKVQPELDCLSRPVFTKLNNILIFRIHLIHGLV